MFTIKRQLNVKCLQCLKAFKHQYVAKNWKKKEEAEDRAIAKALAHFDDVYQNYFTTQWQSIRLALLSPKKQAALLNNFSAVDKTEEHLQNLGAMNMKTIFELEKKRTTEYKMNDCESVSTFDEIMEEEDLEMIDEEEAEDTINLESELNRSTQEQKTETSISSSRPKDSLHSELLRAKYDRTRTVDPEAGNDENLLQEFIPATKLTDLDDYAYESDYYNSYNPADASFSVNVEEHDLCFPKHLKLYTYERGNITKLPRPRKDANGLLNFYVMDAASILPVIALEVRKDDHVFDMCAAPGGKALAIMQTLYPEKLVCNDSSTSRTKRIRIIFRQYLPQMDLDNEDRIFISVNDGVLIEGVDMYDKILVDVPCTNDRHSLHDGENNIFTSRRIKERLRLPNTQTALLVSALKLVKSGGSVVYSTCSLSPIQNEGVVHTALRAVWEETKNEYVVKDLTPALMYMRQIFKFNDPARLRLKFGHLVLPFVPMNYGPMYFCRIDRIK